MAQAVVNQIKAVFFDAGNTLIYAHPNESAVLAAKANELGVNVDVNALAGSLSLAFHELERLTMNDASFWGNHADTRLVWLDFYVKALQRVGVDGVAPTIAEAACEHFADPAAWSLYPEVPDVLDELARRGIVTGIVSNWDLNLPAILHALGITDRLDFLLASGRIGHSKPYPEIFQAAIQRSGIEASACLHVGDHYFSDVLGARGAGIQAVLLDRKQVHENVDCTVVSDLSQIYSLL